MRTIEKSTGLLSLDFVAGFTIFILSLVMVANFIPSLLVGLQRSRNIDFDAVAYRTGVILVEDPGQGRPFTGFVENGTGVPGNQGQNISWDRIRPSEVDRLGLAVARGVPNILSINKINRFFCTTAFGDADYRSKMLFSSYQYGYNITLQNLSPMQSGDLALNLSVGTGVYPSAGFGYIRRYVLIKQNPAVNLDLLTHGDRGKFDMGGPGVNLSQANQAFTVRLNGSTLYNRSIDAPYNLDMQTEPLIIRLTNFRSTLNNSAMSFTKRPAQNTTLNNCPSNCQTSGCCYYKGANLTGVTFTRPDPGGIVDKYGNITPWGQPYSARVDNVDFIGSRMLVTDNISVTVYLDADAISNSRDVDVNFIFNDAVPQTLIGGILPYDYNKANVQRPDLATGMLEVGIW